MAERGRFFSVAEFQQTLVDSENRRKVLLQTIQETQETIRAQSLRLDETEQLTKERQKELDTAKNKERDYQRYITNLERQLLIGKQRQEGQLKILEDAENKLELLEEEASTLRSSVARLQGECKHKDDKLKTSSSRLQELEEENASLMAELESANQKLLVQLESMTNLREENAFLDKQAKSDVMDAERLRKENTSLFNDVKQLRKQVTSFSEKSSSYMKEISILTTQLQTSNLEEKRLKGQLVELQKINVEMKDIVSNFTSEKDRFFRERLEFCAQIQNLAIEKDALFRERLLADDEANDLSSDLMQVKQTANKLAAENKRLMEELNEIRKVHDSRSFDVLKVQYKLDQQKNETHSAEQRKQITSQQDELYEDEIRSLERQLIDCQKVLKATEKEKDWALAVRDELISKLQDEMRKLIEEKHNLEWMLEIKDASEAKSRQRKLEYVCNCQERSRKESSEDVFGRRSRNEDGEDFRDEFDDHLRQEGASAYNFSSTHSSYANISQGSDQMLQKMLSSERKGVQSSRLPVDDIFCESWYAENNRRLVLSGQATPEPKSGDQQVSSWCKTARIESENAVPASNLLGVEAKGFNEGRTILVEGEKLGEYSAKTDLHDNGGGSKVKDTAKVRDQVTVATIQDLKGNICLHGKAEHLQVNNLEKDDFKVQKESREVNSSSTKAIKQEDTVKLKEENSKMEIYVCVTDDQDEQLFEEGSSAFLVLLPPNSTNISVSNENTADHHGQKGNGVKGNCVTGDKNDGKPQTNSPSGVENKADTSDNVQIYRLTSDENETFRNHLFGQNLLEESFSSGTPIFEKTEHLTPGGENFTSAALASENIQHPKVGKDTVSGRAGDNNMS